MPPLKEARAVTRGWAGFNRVTSYDIYVSGGAVKYGFPTLNIALPPLPEGWFWDERVMEKILHRATINTKGYRRASIYGPVNHILARQYQYDHLDAEPMWRYHLQDHQDRIAISRKSNLIKLPLMFPNSYAEPKSHKIPGNCYTTDRDSCWGDENITIELGALRDLVRKTSYEKADYTDLDGIELGSCELTFLVDPRKKVPADRIWTTQLTGAVEYTGTECIIGTKNRLHLNFFGDQSVSDYILLRILNEDKKDPDAVIKHIVLQMNAHDRGSIYDNGPASSEVWKKHVGSVRPGPEWYIIPCSPEILKEFSATDSIILSLEFYEDKSDKPISRMVDTYIH